LFICGGAFVGLEKIIERRLGKHVLGFSAAERGHKAASVDRAQILQHVEPEDLLSFGFIPEFIGRLPMVTVLAELTEDQMVSVLTEPKNALAKQFAKLMAMEGVDLEFSADALRELAVQALKKGTGARALRGLIERIMLDVMYDVPNSEDILTVKITRNVVLGETKPIVRRKQDQTQPAQPPVSDRGTQKPIFDGEEEKKKQPAHVAPGKVGMRSPGTLFGEEVETQRGNIPPHRPVAHRPIITTAGAPEQAEHLSYALGLLRSALRVRLECQPQCKLNIPGGIG